MEPIHAMVWWVVVDCTYNMETDPNVLCVKITWMILQTCKEHDIITGEDCDNEDDCWDFVECDEQSEKFTSGINIEPTKGYDELVKIFTGKFGEGRSPCKDVYNWVHQGGLIVMGLRPGHEGISVIVEYKKTVFPHTLST